MRYFSTSLVLLTETLRLPKSLNLTTAYGNPRGNTINSQGVSEMPPKKKEKKEEPKKEEKKEQTQM
ncbi:MAG: hypothetical protein ACPL1Y_05335 [Thermoplasmata archaeon]